MGEKRTNEQYAWVNSSARRELCNTAFPVCMCKLTLVWILAKLLQSYWNADSSWPVFLTGTRPNLIRLVSLLRCRLVCPSSVANCPLLSPFVQLSDSCPVTSRSQAQNPLSGFAPKQTKESSAWRTNYIVLQCFGLVGCICQNHYVIGVVGVGNCFCGLPSASFLCQLETVFFFKHKYAV